MFTFKIEFYVESSHIAPTNYTDFVATTPRPNQSYPDLQNSDVKVTKIVRKSRNASASPHAERKISTGSNSSTRGGRRAPQERQPIMVASIANFDQPRKFSSVKAPNFRKAISTQTSQHSNPGSDYDSDFTPAGEISISIKTDPPGHQLQAIRKQTGETGKVVVDVTDQGLVTRGNDDIADERIAESPQLFIPPSPPPPPTETPPPPQPPTPLPERKKLNAKADELINQHHDLIKDFPPVPACVAKDDQPTTSNNFPEITVNIGRKVPPPIPRKDRINHANVHKMKIITAKNASEVHRRKSPQHGPDPNLVCVPGTPIFSDAERTSIVSHSVFSDGHSTDGEQQQIQETIGESKIPVMTNENERAHSSTTHDDTELESVKGFG